MSLRSHEEFNKKLNRNNTQNAAAIKTDEKNINSSRKTDEKNINSSRERALRWTGKIVYIHQGGCAGRTLYTHRMQRDKLLSSMCQITAGTAGKQIPTPLLDQTRQDDTDLANLQF